MESRPFPQYLSNPIQVLWFESDELIIILFCFVISMAYSGLAWLVLFAGPYLYHRTKQNKPRGYLFHVLYALGLLKMEGYPSFFEKEFHE